jgi:hypothetical protein
MTFAARREVAADHCRWSLSHGAQARRRRPFSGRLGQSPCAIVPLMNCLASSLFAIATATVTGMVRPIIDCELALPDVFYGHRWRDGEMGVVN